LADTSWNVRKAAAGALKRIGNPALANLKAAINHASENVRYWTTRILASMGNEALSPLIEALEDPNQEIRIFAATALGDTEDKRSVYPLINALKDREWLVRKSAADSLMKIGLMHIEILVKSMNDPNPDIRYWVERIIGEIGDKAIKPLIDVLRNDRNREMRFFAAFGLSAIGDKTAVPALIDALSTDVNDWVRKYSAQALGRINDPRGIKALIEALGRERGDISEWIVNVLSKLENPPVDLIAKRMREGTVQTMIYCIDCLGKIKHKDTVKHLISKLNTEDETIVPAVTRAFVETGPGAIPELVKALEDENWAVRKNSADILSMLGESAEEALNQALVKEDKNLRYWATSALRKLKKKGPDSTA
jgi:HEAT repeat protein